MNRQSNAAPPASEYEIARLDRVKLDDSMKANSKAECIVCLDEVMIGEEVVVMPCKHWFHEACIKLWLREHNTCPICRSSTGADNENGNQSVAF